MHPVIASLLLVLASSGLFAASDPPPALIGSWQEDGTEGSYCRFEPDGTCTMAGAGTLQFFRGAFPPAKIIVKMQGQRIELPYDLSGDVLHLTVNDKQETYRRLTEVPAALIITPLAFGSGTADAKRIAELKKAFAKREREDQAVRTDPSKQAKMGEVDRDNTTWLKTLVGELGWIDATRFGAEAANTAFLIVQHSGDLPLMIAALPAIELDVKKKKIDCQGYALLFDRTQLYLGRKQRFGTQVGQNDKGEMIVLACEHPAEVEKRRKEIGLFPLSQYLGFFASQNHGKAIGFEPEEE
ncbi:MAG: hypothetical protein H0W83_11830 [Planctomycetes bacterium]|nr:hypothetical protein [Planctomycetota bacterium]